jgi:hypothetical protein
VWMVFSPEFAFFAKTVSTECHVLRPKQDENEEDW